MNDEIIYFELNDWFLGRDYPPIDGIEELMFGAFDNDEYCFENRLCVLRGPYDMSLNLCVSAERSWVEQNLPQLLTDESYSYSYSRCYGENTKEMVVDFKKYKDFLRFPSNGKDVYGRFGWRFLTHCKENYGVHYYDYYEEEN